MRAFRNAKPRDLQQALTFVQQAHQEGRSAALAGGGSDLLALMKERVVTPDVLVSLKAIKGLDQVTSNAESVTIGGLITLDTLARHAMIRRQYAVLAEAAETVASVKGRRGDLPSPALGVLSSAPCSAAHTVPRVSRRPTQSRRRR